MFNALHKIVLYFVNLFDIHFYLCYANYSKFDSYTEGG